MKNLSNLFKIRYGQKEYHNKEWLDKGNNLLISSQGFDNGSYGFFEIPTKFQPPFITIPSTGSVGVAYVQTYPCSVDDNCLVMLPKGKYNIEYLFYISYLIRREAWRFRYGRQITPDRIGKVNILEPEKFKTEKSYKKMFKELYPKKEDSKKLKLNVPKIKDFLITDLFNLERGQFHAIDKLEQGDYPTVSRISTDNGLVGFYKKPKKAKIYDKGILTVSTVTGDAFLQTSPFIATDNVVMCIPKRTYKLSTLIYIQATINSVKWRYSYGRQPYKRIFQKTIIKLPVTKKRVLDEQYMEKVINNQPYWKEYKKIMAS